MNPSIWPYWWPKNLYNKHHFMNCSQWQWNNTHTPQHEPIHNTNNQSVLQPTYRYCFSIKSSDVRDSWQMLKKGMVSTCFSALLVHPCLGHGHLYQKHWGKYCLHMYSKLTWSHRLPWVYNHETMLTVLSLNTVLCCCYKSPSLFSRYRYIVVMDILSMSR